MLPALALVLSGPVGSPLLTDAAAPAAAMQPPVSGRLWCVFVDLDGAVFHADDLAGPCNRERDIVIGGGDEIAVAIEDVGGDLRAALRTLGAQRAAIRERLFGFFCS